MRYDTLITKILDVINEDKNQCEFILRMDLDKILKQEISDIEHDAYNRGYEDSRRDWEADNL